MVTDLPAPSVPGEGLLTWESQERQYANNGPPGITHEEHRVEIGSGPILALDPRDDRVKVARGRYSTVVDCLLYRSRKGTLVGILNHYRDDCYDVDGTLLERAGNCNVWVHPRRRRRGIGTALVREAVRRWSIDFAQQQYTEGGRALAESVLDGAR